MNVAQIALLVVVFEVIPTCVVWRLTDWWGASVFLGVTLSCWVASVGIVLALQALA